MGRNIVLCFDGTNDKYAARDDTNVVKLYQMLDQDEATQLRYYQPGIGTMGPAGVWGKTKRWWIAKLDLAIAWLLEEHVCAGYRFLMQYYAPGDRIFIFGFSRGAYTARAMAAMVHKVGLLSRGNDELIPFAWDTFRRERRKEFVDGFRRTFSRPAEIHFVGVWDTVSSVGWMWSPTYLPYSANNPSVRFLRHAVALDERRTYFPQNMWTGTSAEAGAIKQVWFPGVHCDVGGGYREPQEAGLSKVALTWMVREAEAQGLLIDVAMKELVIPPVDSADYAAPNALGPKHESLRGWWWIPEVIPKLYRDPSRNYRRRIMLHLGRSRFLPADPAPTIHQSVIERMNDAASRYQPRNLPVKYNIVPMALIAVLSLSCHPSVARADDATILAACPLQGDAKDSTTQHLNVLKRRLTIPSASNVDSAVTMTKLTAPGDDTSRWHANEAAVIEGYVADVKPGGTESVNCHTKTTAYKDTHIELTLKPNGNDESTYVIVEVTPQMRRKVAGRGTDWSTATLRQQLRGRWIRVTGWLLFDVEHTENATNTNPGGRKIWRATVWEVHPITAIEVLPQKPPITAMAAVQPRGRR